MFVFGPMATIGIAGTSLLATTRSIEEASSTTINKKKQIFFPSPVHWIALFGIGIFSFPVVFSLFHRLSLYFIWFRLFFVFHLLPHHPIRLYGFKKGATRLRTDILQKVELSHALSAFYFSTRSCSQIKWWFQT